MAFDLRNSLQARVYEVDVDGVLRRVWSLYGGEVEEGKWLWKGVGMGIAGRLILILKERRVR